jgi:hypothetical protein
MANGDRANSNGIKWDRKNKMVIKGQKNGK